MIFRYFRGINSFCIIDDLVLIFILDKFAVTLLADFPSLQKFFSTDLIGNYIASFVTILL